MIPDRLVYVRAVKRIYDSSDLRAIMFNPRESRSAGRGFINTKNNNVELSILTSGGIRCGGAPPWDTLFLLRSKYIYNCIIILVSV